MGCSSSSPVESVDNLNERRVPSTLEDEHTTTDTALQGLDRLWTPLLDRLDALKPPASPAALLDALADAARLPADARWQHADHSEALLRLHAATSASTPSACASMVRLVKHLALALGSTVGSEEPTEFSSRLQPWRALLSRFGAPRPLLVAALDGPTKGVLMYVELTAHSNPALKLSCSRRGSLWELWAMWRVSSSVSKPGATMLYPRFASSDGSGWEDGEGHGPRKELFSLFGEQLLHGGEVGSRALAPVLPYSETLRTHWFDTSRVEGDDADAAALLSLTGWLMAQSIANRAPLGVRLPVLLFDLLLRDGSQEPGLAELERHDEAASSALRKVLVMSDADFAGLAELEGCCEGTTRRGYVEASVARLLGGCWQLAALRSGWEAALPQDVLAPLAFTPAQLAAAVCGSALAGFDTADFAIREIFRVMEDTELVACTPLRDALWRVLDRWDVARKRAFLRFVTGFDRPPPPRSELLIIEMPFSTIGRDETIAAAGMLPQAHTCANTLELPNYYAAVAMRRGESAQADTASPELEAELEAVLEDRFIMAIEGCDQYGLDELAPPRAGIPTTLGSDNLAVDGIPTVIALGGDARPPPPSARNELEHLDDVLVEMVSVDAFGSTAQCARAPMGLERTVPRPSVKTKSLVTAGEDDLDLEEIVA